MLRAVLRTKFIALSEFGPKTCLHFKTTEENSSSLVEGAGFFPLVRGFASPVRIIADVRS